MLNEFCVDAPCKINIGLKVLPKREDNFHGIESIFSTVSLCDKLFIKVLPSLNCCTVECSAIELPENNTISLTYQLFKNMLKNDLPSVHVVIDKRIPSGGGLGGGSSDAASFLLALNELLNSPFTYEQLTQIASGVGSDVFFFLNCAYYKNNAAIVTGRGENILPIPKRKDLHFLLVFPGVHSSTKEAYSLIDELYESGKKIEYPSLDKLVSIYNGSVRNWNFVNTFSSVVPKKYSKIEQAIIDLKTNGALYTDMSGSGSTVFGVFTSREEVVKIQKKLSGSWNVCSCF